MKEYSMEYPAVLRLPLRTFWALNRQVDRLRAECEQRLLRLHSAATSDDPKSAQSLNESLSAQIGSPVLFETKFDSSRFEELRNRFKGAKCVATETHTE